MRNGRIEPIDETDGSQDSEVCFNSLQSDMPGEC